MVHSSLGDTLYFVPFVTTNKSPSYQLVLSKRIEEIVILLLSFNSLHFFKAKYRQIGK